MGTHQKLITEDLYKQAIAQLASTNKENRTTIRLRAIVAAKEHGIGMGCLKYLISQLIR